MLVFRVAGYLRIRILFRIRPLWKFWPLIILTLHPNYIFKAWVDCDKKGKSKLDLKAFKYLCFLSLFESKLEENHLDHIFFNFDLPARMLSSLAFSAMTRPFSSLKQSCRSGLTLTESECNPSHKRNRTLTKSECNPLDKRNRSDKENNLDQIF